MRKLKLAALFSAAVIMLASAAACNNKKAESSKEVSRGGIIENVNVTPEEEIGSIKHEAKLFEPITVGDTVFTVNNIIDIDHVTSDGRYIYIDYTIENKSDKEYPTDAINNFYIYSSEFKVAPNSKVSNYVGFVIPKDAKKLKVGYYVTGADRDKRNIVLCEATPDDFVAAPSGMMKTE